MRQMACCFAALVLSVANAYSLPDADIALSLVDAGVGDGAPLVQASCLEVRPSSIPGAGQGLFATCPICANSDIGEYLGTRSFKPAMDNEYEWRVPICRDSRRVVHGSDAEEMKDCNEAGSVYIDGSTVAESNPLRFVNGVRGEEEKARQSLAPVYRDGRVWYRTLRAVNSGEELFIDYGPRFWKARDSIANYFSSVRAGQRSAQQETPQKFQVESPSREIGIGTVTDYQPPQQNAVASLPILSVPQLVSDQKPSFQDASLPTTPDIQVIEPDPLAQAVPEPMQEATPNRLFEQSLTQSLRAHQGLIAMKPKSDTIRNAFANYWKAPRPRGILDGEEHVAGQPQGTPNLFSQYWRAVRHT